MSSFRASSLKTNNLDDFFRESQSFQATPSWRSNPIANTTSVPHDGNLLSRCCLSITEQVVGYADICSWKESTPLEIMPRNGGTVLPSYLNIFRRQGTTPVWSYIYIVYKYIYVYFTQQKGHPKVAIYLQVSQCVWRQRWCLCGLNNHVKLCHVWLYNSCGWFKWDIQLYTTFNSHFSTTIKPCKNPCIEDVFTTIKHLNSTITQNIPHKTL